jgi:hypothetical protein
MCVGAYNATFGLVSVYAKLVYYSYGARRMLRVCKWPFHCNSFLDEHCGPPSVLRVGEGFFRSRHKMGPLLLLRSLQISARCGRWRPRAPHASMIALASPGVAMFSCLALFDANFQTVLAIIRLMALLW